MTLARPARDLPRTGELTPSQFAALLSAESSGATKRSVKSEHGQFFTPLPIANFMARMFSQRPSWNLLDPGAGAGVLSCATIEHSVSSGDARGGCVTAYEPDPRILPSLERSLSYAARWAADRGVPIEYRIIDADFVTESCETLWTFDMERRQFDRAICNPPYFKLGANDPRGVLLANVGPWPPNMYALFMMLIAQTLSPDGEMVTITPRSFASGSYFSAFRKWFFKRVVPTDIHLFESRSSVFEENAVLQESLILKCKPVESVREEQCVRLSASQSTHDLDGSDTRRLQRTDVLVARHGDVQLALPVTEGDDSITHVFGTWPGSLEKYGWQVSTGPIVPFRVADQLVEGLGDPRPNTYPLLWMQSVRRMEIVWPWQDLRKPQFVSGDSRQSRAWLVPDQNMVLLRRFSPKEDPRRVTAAPLLQGQLGSDLIGLENHVNYIYGRRDPITDAECVGLAAFLNSHLVDRYIRISNGNTQISARELRTMPFPPRELLREVGTSILRQESYDADAVVADALKVAAS